MKKSLLNITFIGLFVLCYTSLLGRNVSFEEKKVTVVVIDPGHGGKDLGATVGNSHEKDIVLDISKKIGTKIKSSFPDVKIIYTRSSDQFVSLYDRAEIANRNNADLFISVHINAVEQTYVNGAETYVLGQHRSSDNLEVAKKENAVILLEDNYTSTYEGFDPNSPESYIMFELVQDEYLEQSVLFASALQNQFKIRAMRNDRSVRQAGFLVLRQTTMPSVLVEVGFLSNKEERNFLQSETGKNQLAESVLNAFSEYKRKIEEKSKFTINDQSQSNANNITEEKRVQSNNVKSQLEFNNITFSVQISASTRKLKPTAVNFKKEKDVFRKQYGNLYKYFSGSFKTYDAAVNEKKRIIEKFPDAFVVAFSNEELISVKMVLEN